MSIRTRLLGSLLRFITASAVLTPFLLYLFKPTWVLGHPLGLMLSFTDLVTVLIFSIFSFSKESLSECQRIWGCFLPLIPFGFFMGGFYSASPKLIGLGIFLLSVAFSILMFKGLNSGKGFRYVCFKWLGKLTDIVFFSSFTLLTGLGLLDNLGCITNHWLIHSRYAFAIFLSFFALFFIGGGLERQRSQSFYTDKPNKNHEAGNRDGDFNEICCYIPAWSLGSEFFLNLEAAFIQLFELDTTQVESHTQNTPQ